MRIVRIEKKFQGHRFPRGEGTRRDGVGRITRKVAQSFNQCRGIAVFGQAFQAHSRFGQPLIEQGQSWAMGHGQQSGKRSGRCPRLIGQVFQHDLNRTRRSAGLVHHPHLERLGQIIERMGHILVNLHDSHVFRTDVQSRRGVGLIGAQSVGFVDLRSDVPDIPVVRHIGEFLVRLGAAVGSEQ